jgi:hypothetical protein
MESMRADVLSTGEASLWLRCFAWSCVGSEATDPGEGAAFGGQGREIAPAGRHRQKTFMSVLTARNRQAYKTPIDATANTPTAPDASSDAGLTCLTLVREGSFFRWGLSFSDEVAAGRESSVPVLTNEADELKLSSSRSGRRGGTFRGFLEQIGS